jgi:hypothetical protein
VTVDARRPIDEIQRDLRGTIGRYLAGEHLARRRRTTAARTVATARRARGRRSAT